MNAYARKETVPSPAASLPFVAKTKKKKEEKNRSSFSGLKRPTFFHAAKRK